MSFKNTIKRFLRSVTCIRDRFYCSYKGVEWKPDWYFWGLPYIHQHTKGSIRIGENLRVCSKVSMNDLGVTQRAVIRAVRPDAVIQIGDRVGISGASICAIGRVSVGDDVMIGRGVIISDSDSHPIHPDFRRKHELTTWSEVNIEKNAFIGAHSIILKGVTIGEGAVIGAGAVVTKDVPPFAIAAGNPARVLADSRDERFKPVSDDV